MIDFISSWTQGIIVAVVIATIIEMLIPEGSSKKYIKVVIGVYILFNIVAPVINKVTNNSLDITELIDLEAYSKEVEIGNKITQNINEDNTYNIKELYVTNLKKDIKNKIEDKGYKVNNIDIDIENNEEYTIKKIYLKISKQEENKKEVTSNIEPIEEINIKVEKEEKTNEENKSLPEKEKKELKEYLSQTYSVNIENININKIYILKGEYLC